LAIGRLATEELIEGGRSKKQRDTDSRLARYPQFYSRIGFAHEFQPLAAKEIQQLLARRWLTQMERILEIDALQEVTKAVVEAARESLVIGED
jgi:hypothetical protein